HPGDPVDGQENSLTWIRWSIAGLLLLTVGAGFYFLRGRISAGSLPGDVTFSNDGSDRWEAYGGSWERNRFTVTNRSDERGAKLIGGSADWSDYEFDLDLQVLGAFGDAGALIRVSDPEQGVDSYVGYYVGLRSANNTLVIGKANHAWREFAVAQLNPRLKVGHWYHLAIAARGCTIVAVLTDPGTPASTRVALREPHCATRGKIGVRSYSSGGVWSNLKVLPLNESTFQKMSQNVEIATPETFQHTEANFNSSVESDLPIENLATMSSRDQKDLSLETTNLGDVVFTGLNGAAGPELLVHGVVILSAQDIYVQDSTGQAVLEGVADPQIRIGDEVEVRGWPVVDISGVTFLHPAVRVLRSGEPIPPTVVTAAEAALGTYNDRFVQIEGRVISEAHRTDLGVLFDLESDDQIFAAVLPSTIANSTLRAPALNSRVRLNGVARSELRYAKSFYPFVVLLRSSEDVAVIAGPPWWGLRHIMELAVLLSCVLVLGAVVYWQVLQWRFHAVTEERSRMAREIHDTLAQSFAAIAFQLESSLGEADEMLEDRRPLKTALQMAKQSRKDAHVTIATLRSMQTESRLSPMLETVLRPLCLVANIDLRIDGEAEFIPSADIAHQILRIAQEAVSNAIRHASCRQLTVRLEQVPTQLVIAIADDGKGFELETVNALPRHEHFGILGMRERARAIGGVLTIQPQQPGTVVSLQLPLQERTTQWDRLRAALGHVGSLLANRMQR
ncbi:MAG: sensor histidine kinase, partial [Acidobacteriota bacterium]